MPPVGPESYNLPEGSLGASSLGGGGGRACSQANLRGVGKVGFQSASLERSLISNKNVTEATFSLPSVERQRPGLKILATLFPRPYRGARLAMELACEKTSIGENFVHLVVPESELNLKGVGKVRFQSATQSVRVN